MTKYQHDKVKCDKGERGRRTNKKSQIAYCKTNGKMLINLSDDSIILLTGMFHIQQ
jgi:hypothetical protein